MSKILVGVAVWNHWQIIERFVKSLKEHTDLADVEFVIFDNGSDNEKMKDWLKNCDEKVYYIGDNIGCCGGIRKMFEYAFDRDDIEFVVTCAADVLFTDDWLSRLRNVMRMDDNIVLVSPKDINAFHCFQFFNVPDEYKPDKVKIGDIGFNTYVFGDDVKMQEYVKREFYSKRKHLAYIDVKSTDITASVWRKSLVKELGGFCSSFDYALGDIEMMVRIHKKGYRIVYCLSSFIYHHSHGGAGLYEGYLKKFGKNLGEYAKDAMSLIKSIHGEDIADYGNMSKAFSPEILCQEEELVRL